MPTGDLHTPDVPHLETWPSADTPPVQHRPACCYDCLYLPLLPRGLASWRGDLPSAPVFYPLCKELDRRIGLVSQDWSPKSAQGGL